MATASEKVKLEDIDRVLRDAQVCNAQLKFFDQLLNGLDLDETRTAEIESKCSTIFRDMMSNLYSVLDQIYYFVYCHYQNNGDVSFGKAALQINQPIKQDLKWSEDKKRDKNSECEKKRNGWVTDQCKEIFGDNCSAGEPYVRKFQENLLQLQAIRKVDSSGVEVLPAFDGEPDGESRDKHHECEKKRSDWVTEQCKNIFSDNRPEGESYVKRFLENLPMDGGSDHQFKKKLNGWVTDQYKMIFPEAFGDNCPEGKSYVRGYVRAFQEDLLRLQAIRKVNRSGGEVPRVDSGSNGEPDGECNDWLTDQCKKIFGKNCPECESCVREFLENLLRLQANKGPTLLRARDIQHDVLQFSPRNVSFKELKSVKNRVDWNDTINFNLLHFFRNFTTHRCLIECKIKKGYFNVETREFKPEEFEPADQNCIPIAKGAWILVPELSHLRQEERKRSPVCYPHLLTDVCDSLFDFVKGQRDNVLRGLNHIEDYPHEVILSDDGLVTFKKKGQPDLLGQCRCEVAHLWPVVKKL